MALSTSCSLRISDHLLSLSISKAMAQANPPVMAVAAGIAAFIRKGTPTLPLLRATIIAHAVLIRIGIVAKCAAQITNAIFIRIHKALALFRF